MLSPTLAQLEEHLTVEIIWKSRGPWFKSGKQDFFYLFIFMKNKKNNLVFLKFLAIQYLNYILDYIFIYI